MNSNTNPVLLKKNVATFHTARCGSTVVGKMLNDHSKVYWSNEIFLKYMKMDPSTHPKNLLETTLREGEIHSSKEVHGFEIKYLPNQHLSEKCLNMSLEDYIARLQGLGVAHFVGMHRKNHLRRLISIMVGVKKGYWHTRKAETPEMIHINVIKHKDQNTNSLVKSFEDMDLNYEHLQQCLPSGSLFLNYEDDIQHDPGVAYRKICKYIQIEDEHPEIKLKRTNPFSYEKMISNLDDVRSALHGTRYAWILED